MAITIDDFSKIWASTSPLTPYSFSESNYKEGWNFIGATPPSRQMWDFLQKNNDEKMQYLADNYLPLSGGAMTGILTLSDGGIALSDATVGNIVADSISSSVSGNASQEKTICSITLAKGVWVVTGHIKFNGTVASRLYGVSLSENGDSVLTANDGTMAVQSSAANNLSLEVVRIVSMANSGSFYLNAYSEYSYTVANAHISAVRII